MPGHRASGILLHVTSLPSPHGIGDLGTEAYEFVDFLVRARQGLWQVLPLGPTGYADSPYQSFSAFAGNPSLVDLRELHRLGWLGADDVAGSLSSDARSVDFERTIPFRQERLRRAFGRFESDGAPSMRDDLAEFHERNREWLDDYALFSALKARHEQRAWTTWPTELLTRSPEALARCRDELASELRFQVFVQWRFDRQWRALREYARAHGVRVVGDVPIFVAHDSADVWANQSQFLLDERGRPRVVAGVPPDYFSADGQLWGNPLYAWDRMKETGYDWWVRRLRQALSLFDYVRLDHFRGFEACWESPGDALNAASGCWNCGPGADFFTQVTARLGSLPLIAEDLGVITPPVEAMRDQFGYPGMRVLQFAFGDDSKSSDYRPHNFVHDCVVYTGTHDNDTTVGWFRSEAGAGSTRNAEQVARERNTVLRYVDSDGREIHWDFIKLAMSSVARTAVFPAQDVLGLGSDARMNLPGTLNGNWRWRLLPQQLNATHADRLRDLADIYDRTLFE